MTDADKKSLRSFLKEMDDERKLADQVNRTTLNSSVRIATSAKRACVGRLIASFKAQFAEDLFPTCEVCNLPVSDEDSAEAGSNLHMSCYDKQLDEGE